MATSTTGGAARSAGRGRIKVYNPEVFESLVAEAVVHDSRKSAERDGEDDEWSAGGSVGGERAHDAVDMAMEAAAAAGVEGAAAAAAAARKRKKGGRRGRRSRKSELREGKKKARFREFWKNQEQRQKDAEREVRERLERVARRKQARFDKLMGQLEEGHALADRVGRMLTLHEEKARQKAVHQYGEWSEKVHGAIMGRIRSSLEGEEAEERRRVRYEQYDKFLKVTNQKVGLFRDIVIESDYDPFEVNRMAIKARVGKLEDPTKRVVRKMEEEKRMVDREAVSAPHDEGKLGRETLDVLKWGTGAIESTPHGHFARMLDDSTPTAAAPAKEAATYKSRIVMDHYDYPKGREAVDAEWPGKGKRTTIPVSTPFDV